jgi:hypothetical protein
LSSERAICSLADANIVLNDWSLLKAEAESAAGVVGSWVRSRARGRVERRGVVWRGAARRGRWGAVRRAPCPLLRRRLGRPTRTRTRTLSLSLSLSLSLTLTLTLTLTSVPPPAAPLSADFMPTRLTIAAASDSRIMLVRGEGAGRGGVAWRGVAWRGVACGWGGVWVGWGGCGVVEVRGVHGYVRGCRERGEARPGVGWV